MAYALHVRRSFSPFGLRPGEVLTFDPTAPVPLYTATRPISLLGDAVAMAGHLLVGLSSKALEPEPAQRTDVLQAAEWYILQAAGVRTRSTPTPTPPPVTIGDLGVLLGLHATTHAMPMERSKYELLRLPPRNTDADPFLPSDDTDEPWETTL